MLTIGHARLPFQQRWQPHVRDRGGPAGRIPHSNAALAGHPAAADWTAAGMLLLLLPQSTEVQLKQTK